jgi:hypothetical protein
MASLQEKAQYLLCYMESKVVVIAQRNFRQVYQKDLPTNKCVHKWYQETGSVLKGRSPGRPSGITRHH